MQESAIAAFNGGFNCAQSVLSVFCEKHGLDKETALKISCGLGGGCRSGEICGAVSGAILVIGLKYGQHIASDKNSKDLCYGKTVEFITSFKEKNGSVVCREILGLNISEKDEYAKAQKDNLFKTTCVDMIKSSVSLLENAGY